MLVEVTDYINKNEKNIEVYDWVALSFGAPIDFGHFPIK